MSILKQILQPRPAVPGEPELAPAGDGGPDGLGEADAIPLARRRSPITALRRIVRPAPAGPGDPELPAAGDGPSDAEAVPLPRRRSPITAFRRIVRPRPAGPGDPELAANADGRSDAEAIPLSRRRSPITAFRRIVRPRPTEPGDPGLPADAPASETVAADETTLLERWRRRVLAGALRVLYALRLVPEMAVLGTGAGMLDFWMLKRNGFANVYYAAAARSMARNWHNFWYASFDPNGVMSIDKSPLAIWIQALSVRFFGFHSESILIPQAVIGVMTVLVLYDLVRRCFGRIAGFVAGAALATTPITVAMSRHNNPDALVTLCCVAALWFFVRALKDGKLRWIVLSGVMVGLGFEAKMGVALVVVPGIVLAWLWMRPNGWHRTLDQLVIGGIAMTLVAAAWPLLVALTPATQRPWIAGTNDNNILSLIFGYNGFGRVGGQRGGPTNQLGVFVGPSGPVRLLNSALGGQGGWLLGLGLAGLIATAVATRMRRNDPRTGWLIAVGVSFIAAAVVFSTAQGIFHPYYVSLLAPFTAALAGAAVSVVMRWSLGGRLVGGLIAIAAVAGAVAVELVVRADYHHQLAWIPNLDIGVGVGACLLLLGFVDWRIRAPAILAVAATLMVAPAIWSVDTLAYATSSTFPAGGPPQDNTAEAFIVNPPTPVVPPSLLGNPARGGATRLAPGAALPTSAPPAHTGPTFGSATYQVSDKSLQKIIAFVKLHGGGPLAISQQQVAANAIIVQNTDIVGLGGFTGRETAPTVSWFAQQVAGGRVRWVYEDGVGDYGSPYDGRPGDSAVLAAVARVCTLVDTGRGPRADYVHLARAYQVGLYDCAGQAPALSVVG
jgi:4-amino-4-deoxy-L-arabinose transferase-like glycosyltransferase